MGLLSDILSYVDSRKRVIGDWAKNPDVLWSQINEDARDFRRKHANRGLLSTQDLEQTPEWEMAMNAPMGLLGAIKVFHGSPHKFDKFSLEHMGKGQGAQSYGWGGYVAENRKVASSPEYMDPEGAYERITGGMNNRQEFAHDLVVQDRGREEILKAMRMKYGQWVDDKTLQRELDDMLTARGNLYEANLRWPDAAREAADPLGPQHFVDLNKPIGKQSPKIRKAIAATQKDLPANAMADLDGDLSLLFGKNVMPNEYLATMQALGGRPDFGEQALRRAGIPGLRYPDAGSRAAPGGTSNYVVFDDALIELLKRNGIPIK